MQFDAIASGALREPKRLAAAADPASSSAHSPQVCPAEGAPGSSSDSSSPAGTRTWAKELRPSPLPSGF